AAAVALLRAVHAARSHVFGPDHPLTLESLATLALASLEANDPDSAPSDAEVLGCWERVFGADHPDTEELRWRLRTARPAWRVQLSLAGDEEPTVNSPTPIEVSLVREQGSTAPRPALMVVVPSWRTDASVEPALAEYEPEGDPARFVLTAHERGEHDLRLTLYDHATGLVLQDLRTTIRVSGSPTGSEDAPQRYGED
ncbi:tetratricopeptide repeat protein, partial [Streptomyces anthocyanicus]